MLNSLRVTTYCGRAPFSSARPESFALMSPAEVPGSLGSFVFGHLTPSTHPLVRSVICVSPIPTGWFHVLICVSPVPTGCVPVWTWNPTRGDGRHTYHRSNALHLCFAGGEASPCARRRRRRCDGAHRLHATVAFAARRIPRPGGVFTRYCYDQLYGV